MYLICSKFEQLETVPVIEWIVNERAVQIMEKTEWSYALYFQIIHLHSCPCEFDGRQWVEVRCGHRDSHRPTFELVLPLLRRPHQYRFDPDVPALWPQSLPRTERFDQSAALPSAASSMCTWMSDDDNDAWRCIIWTNDIHVLIVRRNGCHFSLANIEQSNRTDLSRSKKPN